jgi:hypothetical protein
MASDRARITYDEQRKYRSVVMQQGRVSLEADFNENVELENEVDRRVTLDVVGPTGTPDEGYGVIALDSTSRHVALTSGTMYVGGVRVSLPRLGRIESWLDLWSYAGQPDWRHPTTRDVTAQREIIWLELFEQEISAVEDRALREVALGGPDTAARLRIMQRIHRTPVSADTCAEAFTDLLNQWFQQGYSFDSTTMRKVPMMMLAVGFEPPVTPADPCDPTAAGGYLEADNQLIRVAVTDPLAGKNRLVWSYDNASFIYSVVDRPAGGNGLKIGSRPVDDEHTPRPGQYAELLQGTAQLDQDTLAAEPFGPILRIAAYDPDEQLITLDSAMPPAYQSSDVLYVRIWESVVDFTDGQPVTLGTTGVRVTLMSGPFAIGEYWTFAVRPGTPTVVYPERYVQAFQPPEGFRRWACPLAVIDWGPSSFDPGQPGDPNQPPLPVADVQRAVFGSGTSYPQVSDCRQHFEDLVTLTKRRESCCIILRPSDLDTRTLQQIIDAQKGKTGMTFCLTPGRYRMSSPLVLTRDHGAITIEGCGRGVIIQTDVDPPFSDLPSFAPGMVQLLDTVGVRLRNLEFEAPRATVLAIEEYRIALRVVDAADCTIESCTFRFPRPVQDGGIVTRPFGAALLATGDLAAFAFRDNTIVGNPVQPVEIAGVVLTPALLRRGQQPHVRACTVGPLSQQLFDIKPPLSGLRIEGNQFTGLSNAVMICGRLHEVAIRENSISECEHGILVLSSHWFPAIAAADVAFITRLTQPETAAATTGILARHVAELRFNPDVVSPEMAVAALVLATYSVFHPSIAVRLGTYATFPFPPGADARSQPLAVGTAFDSSVLIAMLRRYAEYSELFQFARFDDRGTTNELRMAWRPDPEPPEFQWFLPRDAPIDRQLLASPGLSSMFDEAPVDGTFDISHNTMSRRTVASNRLQGLALLTLHDDGARFGPVTPLPAPDQPAQEPEWNIVRVAQNQQLTLASVQNRTTASANELRTTSPFFPAAMLLFERRCSVTGSPIQNEWRSQAFIIFNADAVRRFDGEVPTFVPQFGPSLVVIAVPDEYVISPNITPVPLPLQPPNARVDVGGTVVPIEPVRFNTVRPLLCAAITGNAIMGWPVLPFHTYRYHAVTPWIELNAIED